MFESNISDSRTTRHSIMATEGMDSAAIVTTVVVVEEEAEAMVVMATSNQISNPPHRPP
jgi:hypothetical protein